MKLTVDIEKKLGNFHLRSRFTVDGERFALLGASGCGKSMTLKCIAGIEKPDHGRIVLGERVLFDSEKRVDLPARKRRVGYLFQDYALFPNMTVRGNLLSVTKEREYAEELIRRFGLSEVADQLPSQLSGGQSQRTALARMLSTRPEVILLDEPFSALDNYLHTRMEREILDLLEDFPGVSILVTHDRNEAYRLADRIGVMDSGSLVEVQERKAFFDHPLTVAAARLTGCKNISRLERREDGRLFAVDWGIPVRTDEREAVDSVGYRAHFFLFEEEGAGLTDEENVLDCELQRVIEDTFSMVICFRQKGNPVEAPDSLLTWIVDREKWEKVRDHVTAGHFRLRIDPARLMLLKDGA